MPSRTFDIPAPLADWIDRQAEKGLFESVDEVIVDALLGAMPSAEAARYRRARFEALVRTGVEQLDRGEGVEVDDLDAYFDELMVRSEDGRIDKAA